MVSESFFFGINLRFDLGEGDTANDSWSGTNEVSEDYFSSVFETEVSDFESSVTCGSFSPTVVSFS